MKLSARTNPRPARPRRSAWPIGLAATLALAATIGAFSAPARAAAEAPTLERPVFDRGAGMIVVPYHGAAPAVRTDSAEGGTRLVVEFTGAQARLPSPYKLGVFHPLVSRIEMTPDPATGRVVLSIRASQPARVVAVPDARLGVIKLMLQAGAAPDTLSAAPDPVVEPMMGRPQPLPSTRQRPWAPEAPAPVNRPGRPAEQPGLAPLQPPPPPIQPYAPPSAAPVGYAAPNAQALPGTPASGDYVYRKAIPTGNGRDVTEIEVRTGRRAAIDVARDPDNDQVTVNVTGARQASRLPVSDWEKPELTEEPWLPLGARGGATFRPVAAIDSVLGFSLLSERSTQIGGRTGTNLGTNFSGSGATLWGLAGHLPLGPNANLNVAAESFAYQIQSVQVPDATNRRDEYYMRLQGEYLVLRTPFVLAIGPGYWARYVLSKSNVLAPPTPSLLFTPSLLQHGPALSARVYYPLWNGFAATAEAGGAPYMMGANEAVSAIIGPVYGYQGTLGLKWSSRHVSVFGGYTQSGFGNYNGGYAFNRGGPEVSLVWRF